MQDFEDMYTWVLSQLSASSSSTFYTLTIVKAEINYAYVWAASLFNWPQLEDAKKTSTVASQDYYDTPSTFKPDSIYRMEIDDEKYDPKNFEDFLDYRIDNSTETDTLIFANHGMQFFVFPTPTSSGTNNMSAWGYTTVDTLVNTTDKTIFSDYDPAGNQAVCKQALASLQAKGKDKKTGQVEDAEAKSMLSIIYSKIASQQQKYQRLDHPKFEVPDYFSGKGTGTTGKFSID
jgi:hypothetical protein